VRAALTSEPLGWHARLFREWVLYNALAFTIVLATVYVLAGAGLDVTKQAAGHNVAMLLIALVGALFYGVVLGALQSRVLGQRVPIARRRWIITCIVPGLFAWLVIVVPTVVHTATTNGDLQAAYVLAVSQTIALGPLLGISQATALRPYTTRWAWWIAANIVSWLGVQAAFYIVHLIFGHFKYAPGNGSTIELYLMLLLTTPLTGRWVLWVTAESALEQTPADT
jgi:hypothetical protein